MSREDWDNARNLECKQINNLVIPLFRTLRNDGIFPAAGRAPYFRPSAAMNHAWQLGCVCVFAKVQSLYLFHARPSRWPCLFMLYFLAAVVVVGVFGVSLVIFYGAKALRKLSVI